MSSGKPDSLLPFEDALAQLAAAATPLTPQHLPLEQAAGHVLAEPVHADSPLPREDVSEMDGYAVRADDLAQSPLPLHSEFAAGTASGELPPGHAARIFTGAPVPRGADTVIPQERATRETGTVRLEPLPRGSFIRYRGEVIHEGDILARPGDRLTPWLLSLLVSGGVGEPRVHPKPRVGVLVSGSELVGVGETPRSGQIRDSNGPMMRALIEQSGFLHSTSVRVLDDRDRLRDALSELLDSSDLVLTSGGVSVGDYDYIPDVIRDLGGEILFHRVAMKPGRPVLLAHVKNRWIAGLPGNPFSVLTTWRLFALPLAEILAGVRGAFEERPRVAVLDGPVHNKDQKRVLFHPCALRTDRERTLVEPLGWIGSHDIHSTARTRVLCRVEPGAALDRGESVPYFELGRLHEESFSGEGAE